MKGKKAALLATLGELPDFSLQLAWELGSSVPGIGLLLRRYAPHDTYSIWKVGRCLRVDGTLMGIDESGGGESGGGGNGGFRGVVPQWKRGHFSLIYDGGQGSMRLWFVDHKAGKHLDMAAEKKAMAAAQVGRCIGAPSRCSLGAPSRSLAIFYQTYCACF